MQATTTTRARVERLPHRSAQRFGSKRFLNRELSWIDFDRRVLGLAADRTLPLLERVKFCAIVASNLDEFVAVRMAELYDRIADGEGGFSPDGRTPAQTLADMREAIVALQADLDALWLDDLKPALAAAGIRIVAPADCRPRELRGLWKRFECEVQPLLTPIALGPAAPFPHVPSLRLKVAAIIDDPTDRTSRFVRVNVPQDVPRFLGVGVRGIRVAVEDAIVHFLPSILGGEVREHAVFRVTRDADISLASDADDLLEAMETQLQKRGFGDVVRLEVEHGVGQGILGVLTRRLGIHSDQVYESRAPLGLAALTELAGIDSPELKDEAWHPVTAHPFANRGGTALLARIRRRDLLAHHPYDAYDTSVERFVGASRDPKVAALKATVYRTGNPSATLGSLVDAAEDSKQAVCLVELRARFDERRNIEWSRALERAGVHVVYGGPELKVHAKLSLLVRRERDQLRRYVHIGSGNYHASNASAYEDLSLFTADEDITADVADVFNAVTGHMRPPIFRKLLVGPWFLRDGVLHEIGHVIRAAEAGEAARIRIKVNALVDPEVVEALYAASAVGAAVEVITRGVCVLWPGVPGMSERITVRSVLGRFLDHSRILSFQAGERVSTWIGSADLMPRNFDRRIEVMAPVEDAALRTRISAVLDALLADTHFAWELDSEGLWHRCAPAEGAEPVSAQEVLMQQAVKRARKKR